MDGLAYTAFSGTHQDAINKSLAEHGTRPRRPAGRKAISSGGCRIGRYRAHR
ncbi:hypothetical protein [Mycolicibacterium sp. A43C]